MARRDRILIFTVAPGFHISEDPRLPLNACLRSRGIWDRLQGVLCVGSGAAIRERWLQDPSIEETLQYYDTAFSTRYLKIPTLFGCSCFDPSVPPPGQWSAVNNHPGPFKATPFPVGHFDYVHLQAAESERLHVENLQEILRLSATR